MRPDPFDGVGHGAQVVVGDIIALVHDIEDHVKLRDGIHVDDCLKSGEGNHAAGLDMGDDGFIAAGLAVDGDVEVEVAVAGGRYQVALEVQLAEDDFYPGDLQPPRLAPVFWRLILSMRS